MAMYRKKISCPQTEKKIQEVMTFEATVNLTLNTQHYSYIISIVSLLYKLEYYYKLVVQCTCHSVWYVTESLNVLVSDLVGGPYFANDLST